MWPMTLLELLGLPFFVTLVVFLIGWPLIGIHAAWNIGASMGLVAFALLLGLQCAQGVMERSRRK